MDWKKAGEVLAVVAVPVALVAGSVAVAKYVHGAPRMNPSRRPSRRGDDRRTRAGQVGRRQR